MQSLNLRDLLSRTILMNSWLMKTLPLIFKQSRLSLVGVLAVLSFTALPALAGRSSLAANPSKINFGNVQLGGTQSQFETLTNIGTSSIIIYKSNVTGSGFRTTGLTLPMTLSPGQSITFSLSFTPQASGTVTGSFSASSKYWKANVSVPLSGTGTSVGQLGVAPSSLNFGSVTVGKTATLSSSLTASGGSLTVSAVTSNSSEFALSGFSLPLTIAAGQTVPFNVVFSPQTSGSVSAVLNFATSSSTATAAQSLTGSGVAPAPHTVTLGWNDSGSGVSGYNVYRSGVSGGPYVMINTALDTTTAFVDGAVSAGQTYYYVTTAVNSSGVESAYSNEVLAIIPTP